MNFLSSFTWPRYKLETSTLAKLSVPIVISHLLQAGVTVLDTVMSGHYSTADLSGVAVGSSIWFPFFLFFLGTLTALTPTVSQYHGSGNYDAIAPAVFQSFWIVLLFFIPAAALIFYLDDLFIVMNIDKEIAPISVAYLKAMMWGFPAVMAFNVLRCFSDGLSLTKPAMIAAVIGLVVNAPLNYIFIFGKFGLPEMGGEGCGWASAIAYWVMFLFMAVYIAVKKVYKRFHIFKTFYAPNVAQMLRLLKLGFPIGLTIVMEASLFSLAALFLAPYGPVVVASHHIALNVASMVFMVPMSLSQALTIRVGFMVGQRNPEHARFVAVTGISLGVGYALCSATLLSLFRDWIPMAYNSDPQVISLAASLILFAAVFQIVDALQASAIGSLRGYKDTQIPMAITFVAYWLVGFPVAYSLGLTDFWGTNYQAQGFWTGLVFGLLVASILLIFRLYLVSHRKLKQAQ